MDEVQATDGDPADLRSEIARVHGEALQGLGRGQSAEAAMTEALGLDPKNPRVAVARAGWAIAAGRPVEARSLLEAALAQGSESPLAWEMLGALAQRAGDPKAADAAYAKAVGSPTGWLVHYKRALLRIDTGDLDGATEDLEAVAAVRPGFAGLAYGRGRLALAQGKPEPALGSLEAYLRAQPQDPDGAYYAAVALIELNRLAQAEEYLVRVRQAAPGLTQPALLLARLHLERGDPKGAESILRPLAGSGPEAIDRTLAQALAAQGRGDEANRVLLARAGTAGGDSRLALTGAARLIAAGKADEALDLLRPIVSKHPSDGDARLLLIRALATKGDRAGALSEARGLAALAPNDARALNALGVALAMSGDAQGARDALQKAVAAGGPGAVDAALGLARAEDAAGRPEAARQVLESAEDDAPDDDRLVAALAALDRRTGDPQAALKRLREALAQRPAELDLRLTLARRLLADKHPDEALQVLGAAPPDQARGPAVLRLLGQAALAADRPDLALPPLERLAGIETASALPRCLLAQAQAGLGRTADARASVLDAWKRKPDAGCLIPAVRRLAGSVADAPARAQLLDALVAETQDHPTLVRARRAVAAADGDPAARSALLKETLAREPERREALVALMALTRQTGDDATRRLAQAWLERHPDDIELRLRLAGLLTEAGDTAGAIAAYETALASLPPEDRRSAGAANNLAWLLRGSDPTRALALALARQAQAREPGNPAFDDTLGTLLLAGGQPAQAVPLLAAASQARGDDPSLRYRYARALVESGDPERAKGILLGLSDRLFPERAEARALLLRVSR